ncbi:hypothetical protein FHU41_000105 [Psychromicrobium silvestre]|uniref:DUF306 domain-containing protein n=1 Tax=Psychromicrobium silvestre TaxID=1645614 RepID=A0A7Y9LQT6_9MICC|nr:META domain-containing protein [Psychromicrobium silvestre]NYE93884.1 hypothetical protein [Psychromicrobium silvestre]
MKHFLWWSKAFSALFLCLLLTSCGSGPVGGPGTAVNTPSASSSTPPQESCAVFLPATPCSQYVSVSGASHGVVLPWLAKGGLIVGLTSVNGGLQFTAKTPCDPISGPATLSGNSLTVGKLAVGAAGCVGDQSQQQQWMMQFLKQPITMTFSQNVLTWTSGTDTLSFKSR